MKLALLVVLIFLALNATLAVVQWIPMPPDEGAPTLAKAVPGQPIKTVVLAKEIAEKAVEAVQEVAPKPMRCYAAGPFPKLDQAVQVQAALQEEGFQVATEERHHPIDLGYWVYLPPARSATIARLLEDDLRAKGLQESIVIKTGELRNAVAVGVFREPSLAEKRQGEVKSLGFKPVLARRGGEEIEVWLRVAGSADATPPSIEPTMTAKALPAISVEVVACT